MSKHQRVFKLEVAKRALQESSTYLSREYNIARSLVKYWASVYRIHGLDSFRHSEYPYSCQFKLKVITTMHEQGWSLNHTSAYFDLSTSGILFQWQKLYAHEGISRLKPKKKGRPRMKQPPSEPKPSEQMTEKELRDELEYLRAENAVLKKFEALAQAKKKLTKKKP